LHQYRGVEPNSKKVVKVKFKADIAALVLEIEDLSTLSKAVSTAKLVPTLKGPGPLTLFAPDNGAFAKLPRGTLEDLVRDNKLIPILKYHIVPGKYTAADVGKYKTVKSLEGSSIEIHQSGLRHGVRINDADVIEANLECTNGVIHIIDTVLMPK
jgi:uncharacterized surface protein with fasciclin (FAS1) repeats